MSDARFPPLFGEPEGPLLDDEALVGGYARGEVATAHSPTFRVEDDLLVTVTGAGAALRLGPGTVLVRTDLAEELATAKPQIEAALAAAGLQLLDEETLLAPAVAIQRLGLRFTVWDLWGRDLDEAFADLRAAATGDDAYREPGPQP